MLGQNLVDVRNEERRSSHYEISPREREDEDRRHERDLGTGELEAEDQDDRIRRSQEGPPEDG